MELTDQAVIEIVRDAFYYVMVVVGPILLAALIIGLIISIFQAATSISEQTLTFVPKLIGVIIIIIIMLPFMIRSLKSFAIEMIKRIGMM